jgi:hypothetical protein
MRETFDKVLNAVRPVAPEAIIAGGAVRDYLLNREPKDIDVWVNAPNYIDAQTAALKLYPTITNSETEEYTKENSDIVIATELKNAEGEALNLIGVSKKITKTEDVLDLFDFGLCRVAYDGSIIRTTQFMDDADKLRFTLLSADNPFQFARSMRRYIRLTREKYPMFSLLIPEHFSKFINPTANVPDTFELL